VQNEVIPSQKKVICFGNSLTFGANYLVNSPYSYPAQLSSSYARVMNYGVNGQTTIGLLGNYYSDIAPQYRSDTLSIIVIWEIGNSIWVGWDIDSTKNQIERLCSNAQATGYKVILVTAPHRGFSGSTPGGDNQTQYNDKLDLVNDWVRTNYTGFADKIVNADLDSDINDFNNTTYRDADKIHYIAAGYTLIKDLIKQKIDEL